MAVKYAKYKKERPRKEGAQKGFACVPEREKIFRPRQRTF